MMCRISLKAAAVWDHVRNCQQQRMEFVYVAERAAGEVAWALSQDMAIRIKKLQRSTAGSLGRSEDMNIG